MRSVSCRYGVQRVLLNLAIVFNKSFIEKN